MQLATELACTKRQAASATDELHLARDELERLSRTSDAAEAAVLQLQGDAADTAAALAELQAERDSALQSLEKQGAQLQVRPCCRDHVRKSWWLRDRHCVPVRMREACCTRALAVQEMELMHRDARSDAATLRRHCAELKAAADAAQDAHAAQLESAAAQWEFRLSQREAELLAAQQLLQGQLARTRGQMRAVEEEAREARGALQREAEGQRELRSELEGARRRLRDADAVAEAARAAAGQRDEEVRTLHGQVWKRRPFWSPRVRQAGRLLSRANDCCPDDKTWCLRVCTALCS